VVIRDPLLMLLSPVWPLMGILGPVWPLMVEIMSKTQIIIISQMKQRTNMMSYIGDSKHNKVLEQSQIRIPPQFRMLKAGDKIAWLGKRLMEVKQERDSLQLKIEDSSEMLITDLEESQKRISEFSAEIVAIKAKKDFFSESLAVQDEFVRVQGPI
jgi:hypothetical protein